MRIIVTAGGTMGHINPALAIIKEFEKREKNLEVLYIGTTNRMEKDIIPQYGYKYIGIEMYGLSKNIKRNIKTLFLLFKNTKYLKKVMKEFKPDICIGCGGYVTYPVIKTAHKLGIKTFIHEQNSIPGKSNILVGIYSDLIGVTFKESKKYFKGKGKVFYSGHPCGAEALNTPSKDKSEYKLTKNKKLITIVAGSLGSLTLNNKMKEYLSSAKDKDYEIVYVTGKSHYEEFIKDLDIPSNVRIVPFVNELPGLLKISDAVVSRAGAGALAEILALKLPSIIIPSPYVANNHQYYNAKELENNGKVLMIEEDKLTKELIDEKVNDILFNEELRDKLINNMNKDKVADSSYIIYNEIKNII